MWMRTYLEIVGALDASMVNPIANPSFFIALCLPSLVGLSILVVLVE
jgi:hypothetical protein